MTEMRKVDPIRHTGVRGLIVPGVASFLALAAIAAWKFSNEPSNSRAFQRQEVVRGDRFDALPGKDQPADAEGLDPLSADRRPDGAELRAEGDAAQPGTGRAEQHGVDTARLAPRDGDLGEEYPDLGFEVLASYAYVPPPRQTGETPAPRKEQIPDYIRAFSGSKVAVTGFMLPTEMEEDRVTEFLLLRSPMHCCFSNAPQVNEWVVVTMTPDSPPLEPGDRPVSALGVLEVGEEFRDGWVTSVYRLRAVDVEVR